MIPTKLQIYGDKRLELFKNLVEYRAHIIRKPCYLPTIQWLSREYRTYLYKGRPCIIQSHPDDYESIDILTDYFTESERLKAKRVDREWSPQEYWDTHYDQLVQKTLERSGCSDPIELRDQLWHEGLECSSFKLSLAKAVYEIFGAKRILDISAGWGDRLLAAIAHGVERYVGFDPNTNLEHGHNEIIEYFSKDKDRYSVFYEPFETASLSNSDRYNLIFSSPPYYDLENYTDLPGQSIQNYPDFNDWMVGFLFKSLLKSWNQLEIDGHMVIHICDYYKTHYVEAMIMFVLGWCPGSYFDGVIGSVGASRKARPMWVFRKNKISSLNHTAREDLERYYPELYSRISLLD